MFAGLSDPTVGDGKGLLGGVGGEGLKLRREETWRGSPS